jgi:pyruvate/2-oxoglutarate dehydrogenase complex dihydrolipoamide dehydrogenase (E3) component
MGRFTPDLCIIGAGAGGLAVAAGAARLGARVVLIERGEMGGDCLNTGCVPSKSLLAAARFAHLWRRSGAFGIAYEPPRIDFAAVGEGVEGVIATLAPNDSEERFAALGVRVLRAEARFTGPASLTAAGEEIGARRFVIAAGSSPAVPPIPGLEGTPFLTNETIFRLRAAPSHLIVIGGGPIGVELAQAHCRLGSRVTVIDVGPFLPRDDPELVALLVAKLVAEGIEARPHARIARVEREGSGIALSLESGERILGSHLLVAAGRRPSLEALDLEKAGIASGPQGIAVNRRLVTTNRRAFAIGDAAGGPQFTHIALYHAGIVIKNALFHIPAKVDTRALPWVTYTDPELAHVGLSERAARERGSDIRVLSSPFAENDRAQAERAGEGLVKIVASSGGRILGASILGVGAGELILPFALAISQKIKLRALAELIVPYPTLGEAAKRAAASFFAPRLFSPGTRRLVRLLARLP